MQQGLEQTGAERDSQQVREYLDLLVKGMTGLKHTGRFNEPNLDGSEGDYISFKAWEWPQGVGLYGLMRLYRKTGDTRLLTQVQKWFDGHIAAGLPALNVNTSAPMLALTLLWQETGQPNYKNVLHDWATRMLAQLPRTPEGAFQHDVSDRVNDSELWDDTLFMAGLFLAAFGDATNDRELADTALGQFLVHTRYLGDRHTGLWFHGWTFEGRHNFAQALWARGNAWVTVSFLDLFDLAKVPRSVRTFLLGVLEAQLEALLRYQTASGGWTTLIDDPSSYVEMSATAGFGYGLLKAARLGIGPKGCARAGKRALELVVANIDENGVLGQVSYGTRMGHDLQFYRDIPIQPTGYGQALAILCLTEGLDFFEREEAVA